MGLDIYAGTLTRYYSHNWKTAVQQWAEENGYSFSKITPDGEMIEVTKEVAYAMNNFYRSSKAKKVEIKNELGEVVDKMLREVPYSGQSIDGEVFMIEDFPDLNCDVEHCVLTKMEQQDIHKVINQLNSEERMIIYGIFFENKTQTQMAEIMGISRQMLSYKLKSTLNKMREMYVNKFF